MRCIAAAISGAGELAIPKKFAGAFERGVDAPFVTASIPLATFADGATRTVRLGMDVTDGEESAVDADGAGNGTDDSVN